MHESTSTRPNGEERMLALSGTEPEEGPEVELWTRLHRTRVQDFANSVERLRQAAQALAVAVHYGYVEVAELVPTPAIALDDARMVGRLVAHIEGELDGAMGDLGVIQATVNELLHVGQAAAR